MTNQLAKDLEIMFENYVEGFEAACVVSRNAKKFRPGDTSMQRAGDVIYRPQHYHMNVEDGLDLTGKTPTDLVQRLVPSVFKEPKNILYTLDAREMRDPEHKTEAGRAAGQRLAAQIDSDLITTATQRATNVVAMANNTSGGQGRDLWNAAAGIDAIMTSIGVPQGINRRSFWNPFNYKDLAGELGMRAYAQGVTLTAYEKAQIPPVASFDSYKTDISGRVPAGTDTAITLAAAPAHKVVAKDANGMPVDNRQGTITVSGAGLQVGDAFTIAGVNSVHQITKDTTGQLQTFRVLAVSGTTITISPQILPPNNADVPSRPYANVDANAANGAALTLLNNNAAPANLFWADGSVELMYGKLAFPTGQGPQVMTATTEQGATLIMSYAFDHIKGSTTARFTTLYGCSVLVPEYVGLVIAGQ
ncbi:P22 phage major capsid protein family protein [Serratia marcescens]|uniref:P22 phage major capsid protein family protein n=1 Tax=Serratia marcescens TaxID=615 RepID=UPI000744F72A|nr:P22 phage major capsid protein family protein [Serratia marcescens]CVF68264.1 P22 coat protein-gene protein 5 [Serratia marcescens]